MISFVYPYYNNLNCVKNRLTNWSSFSKDVLKELQFVLIDDHSERPLTKQYFSQFNLNLICAKVKDDIDWNQSGAHNLGCTLATSEWLFVMDIDHWVNEETIKQLLQIKDTSTVYYFPRHYKNTMIEHAPNIYLITKENFWKLGGYDEDFAGHYGHEDKLFNSLIRNSFNCKKLSHLIVEVDNAPTRGLTRDTSINLKLLESKSKNKKYLNGPVIRFKWELIVDKKMEV